MLRWRVLMDENSHFHVIILFQLLKNFSGCRLKFNDTNIFQSWSRPFGHLTAVVHFFKVAVHRWISLRRNGIIWGLVPPGERLICQDCRTENLELATQSGSFAIRKGPQGDTLGERETLQEFEDFMLHLKLFVRSHQRSALGISHILQYLRSNLFRN